MLVHKLNRLIFEFEHAVAVTEPEPEPAERVPFELMIKTFSKMTNEEKELFLSELDESTKKKIEEIVEGGLL